MPVSIICIAIGPWPWPREREVSLLPVKPCGVRTAVHTHTHLHSCFLTGKQPKYFSVLLRCVLEPGKSGGFNFSFHSEFVHMAGFKAAEFPSCLRTFSSPNLSNAAMGSEPGERMKMRGAQQWLSTKAILRLKGGASMKGRPKLSETNSCTMGIIWAEHKWRVCMQVVLYWEIWGKNLR